MFTKFASNYIDERIDWFFEDVLREHYDNRRSILRDASLTAIDYILKTYTDQLDIEYPPNSSKQWKLILNSQLQDTKLKQIFIIYLKLDIGNYLSLKEQSMNQLSQKILDRLIVLREVFKKFDNFPTAFEFPNSIVHTGTGLWAIDNGNSKLSMVELTSCSIKLNKIFRRPKDIVRIITDSLTIDHHPKEALFINKAFNNQSQNEDFYVTYVSLLIITRQYAEALRYQRLFRERENYDTILEHFFDTCCQQDAMKQVSKLHLSSLEESKYNEFLVVTPSVASSRPVTPSCSQTSIVHATSKQGNNTTISSSQAKTPASAKHRNLRHVQLSERNISLTDSPARNTRSARRRKK